MKKILGALIMCALFSCSVTAENPFKFEDSKYEMMIKSTLVDSGNNFRLKKCIEKIKKGEKVYIAAIGGSVTEGAGPKDFKDGYAYQFFNAVKKVYSPKNSNNVFFDNAGLSGTPSLLGKLRYESDVVQVLGHIPDILIIEFAVNDGGEEVFKRSFEALVRDALLASPQTAVIALYSAATYGNTAEQKKPVANYYDIPQIDIMPVVNDAVNNNIFAKEDFYSDYVHPTKQGHTLMSDSLMYLLKIVDEAKADSAVEVPQKPLIQKSLGGLIRILDDDKNVKISKGSFNTVDNDCQTLKKTGKSDFPVNWHKKQNSASCEPFKMEIKCKSLVFTYKVQGSWMNEKFGKAQVYVDGKLVNTFDGAKKDGWNNCEVIMIIDESEAKNHKVEVKMLPSAEKLGFTIVAMGYTE